MKIISFNRVFPHTHTHTALPTVKLLAFVLFAAISLNSNKTIAQVNPEWKTHGNTADSSAFIGTTNDACLRFRSNNIERESAHKPHFYSNITHIKQINFI